MKLNVGGGGYGQENLKLVCKFILRDINVRNVNSYVIKNPHIYYKKDTFKVLNDSIVKP